MIGGTWYVSGWGDGNVRLIVKVCCVHQKFKIKRSHHYMRTNLWKKDFP